MLKHQHLAPNSLAGLFALASCTATINSSAPSTLQDQTERVIDSARSHITDWAENEGRNDPQCHDAQAALAAVEPLLQAAPAMLRLLALVASETRKGHLDVRSAAIAEITALLSESGIEQLVPEIYRPDDAISGVGETIRPGVLYRDWIAKNDHRISAYPSEETLATYDKFADEIVKGKSALTTKEDFARFGRLREYGNRNGFSLVWVYATFDDGLDVTADGLAREGLIHDDDIEKVASVLSTDVLGDYDDPEHEPDMRWVQHNASYLHSDNGQDGIWEFLLNLANEFEDVPEKFKPLIAEAKRKNIGYLLIHQGT